MTVRWMSLLSLVLFTACGPEPVGGGEEDDAGLSLTDAGAVPGRTAFGGECQQAKDCLGRVCLDIGRCSKSCEADEHCPGIVDWSCAPLPEGFSACQCTPTGVEACDGRDNDCDGLVDDGAACEAGHSCVDARCVCLGTMCGGACVDTLTDEAHCGKCSNACAVGASCAAGSCACPSGQLACEGRCIGVSADPLNCGACGRTCTGGTECRGGACVCPAGLLLCGGKCVDPTSDEDHCGRCNNACATGGSCADSICRCPAKQVICGGACTDLETSGNHCGACGRGCNGDSCSSGRCPVTTVATSTVYPRGLAVHGGSVYWASYLGGYINKVAVAGGTPGYEKAGLIGPNNVHIDGNTLFWTSGEGIFKATLGTSEKTLLAADYYASQLALDATHVYWISTAIGARGLRRVQRSGGAVEELADVSGSWGGYVARDGSDIYWADSYGRAIKRMATGGGAVTTLATAKSGLLSGGLAVNASHVFWAHEKTVWRVAKAGGESEPVFVAPVTTGAVASFLLSSTHLYLSVNGSIPGSGWIFRVPLAGGDPLVLASGLNSPAHLALDAQSLYWTAHAAQQDARIQRVAR